MTTATVDMLVQMLAETREELRRQAAHTMDSVSRHMETSTALRHAEQTIEEWVDYSQSWHPLIPAKRRKELKPPKAYTREIPL